MFQISLVAKIRADKQFVFDWWTDLVPEDSALVKPLKSREILSRSPTEIVLHDEEKMYFKTMKFDVKVSLRRPDGWTAEYDGSTARARSEYLLTSASDRSTVLSYHSRIEPKGTFLRAMPALVKPFVRRILESEMKIFIRMLEREYEQKKCERAHLRP